MACNRIERVAVLYAGGKKDPTGQWSMRAIFSRKTADTLITPRSMRP